eukprot:TRINITY_DN8204_c0_g1_i1.p1 TRINITY_DN8204_c0_g1~~TRINITY_DN8204_c0_g1_i1.p1  ORF type:complete len:124 (-),score=31.02 TRINITY_DN8204_c0_g1_i1:189-560(-)
MDGKIGGGTPYNEAVLQEKRKAIRNALKHEWIQKKFHPNAASQGGVIFDAALQRWTALQFTYGEHFKPSLKNFMQFSLINFATIGTFYYMCYGPEKKNWLAAVSRGEVAYDHPSRKKHWIVNS